jgi:pyruvate dehydrogenase E1 component alpha subunit
MYSLMARIREVEEQVVERYPEQEIRCPTHLSIGQEAVAVGVCAALREDDHVYSTHRCHAHYLAKGGDLQAMVDELYGRRTGCSQGKGGSMHLVDSSVGMMGASAIVGGTIPMAVGSALAFQMQKTDRVAVAFFGDGAVEEGVFHESLSFASVKRLPVLFVCENNLYATYSAQGARQPADNIHKRARAYLIPGVRVDGNDVVRVYGAAGAAVARARAGLGPTLIECRTYRWRDHVGPNFDFEVGYRSREEVEAWMARCPIKRCAARLRRLGLTEDELGQIREQVRTEALEAFRIAKSRPFPEPAELASHVYG